MTRALHCEPTHGETDEGDVRFNRRRQVVVVRSGDSSAPLPAPPGRRRMPTLMGLDRRERQDTITDESVFGEVPESRVRPVGARGRQDTIDEFALSDTPLPDSRVRPVVLREDTDEQIVAEYRRQAALILGSGRLSEIDIDVE